MNRSLPRYALTRPQKMMVFIMSMSLYGLSNMFTELIPSVKLGVIELQVEYFAFIPLAFCILFHPLYAAVGASVGEVVFGELMLGQFGGLGEVEKFITFSMAMFLAGLLVRDPKSKPQVGLAAMLGVVIHQFLSSMVDIFKVWFGVEELEAVEGLAESILVIEGVEFLTTVLFSGILFALLPTLYLVPRLYGKIEPLLGMKPRDNQTKYSLSQLLTPRLVVAGIALAFVSVIAEFASETDFSWEWEADFIGQYGDGWIWVSIGTAAFIFVAALIGIRRKAAAANPQGSKHV